MDPRTTLRYRIRVQRDERPSISPRYNPQGSRTGPGAKSDIYDSLVSEGWRQVRYAVHGGLRDTGAVRTRVRADPTPPGPGPVKNLAALPSLKTCPRQELYCVIAAFYQGVSGLAQIWGRSLLSHRRTQ